MDDKNYGERAMLALITMCYSREWNESGQILSNLPVVDEWAACSGSGVAAQVYMKLTVGVDVLWQVDNSGLEKKKNISL